MIHWSPSLEVLHALTSVFYIYLHDMFDRKLFLTIKRPLLWLKARLSRRFEPMFYDALFAMLAKLCHADGDTNGATLDVVSAFISAELQFKPRKKMYAMSAFRKGRSSTLSFEDYARQFHSMCGPGAAVREAMVDLLLTVAVADDSFSRNEARLVQVAVKIFGISEQTYDKIKQRHFTHKVEEERLHQDTYSDSDQQRETLKRTPKKELTELELAYQTLECEPSSSLSEIKSHYRQLAKRYHPDSHAHSDMPAEVMAFCETRFRELQVAYDLIQKARSDEKML